MATEKRQGIVILGLGPGDAGLITREGWDHLIAAKEIYLRTAQHPCVRDFPAQVRCHSFDELYETAEDFETVYRQIVEKILELGRRAEGVTYAVPGHPFVAEATAPEIVRRAGEEGIPVRVIEGISFLEPVFRTLHIDPFDALTLVDGLEAGRRYSPPFPPDIPVLIGQVYNREIAAEIKLTLEAVYPDEHPVRLVHGAGSADEQVEELKLYEIDRSRAIGVRTCLYVPALDSDTSLEGFQGIVAHLRAPEGCPWDREQTILSMRNNLLEETYEALEAMDNEDMPALCEELGDLVLIVTMLAQMAAEEGHFGMAQVIQGIQRKIVRRHPHVFGDVAVAGSGEVLRNWESIKKEERSQKGEEHRRKGILDGISPALPALTRAQKFQERAAHIGFDWPGIEGVVDKLREEWREVEEAGEDTLEHELGDLLFSTVNLVRWHKLDAESALRLANQRFLSRFRRMEELAAEEGRSLADLTLEQMENKWQAAKGEET